MLGGFPDTSLGEGGGAGEHLSFYYASSASYIWGQGQEKGSVEHRPFQTPAASFPTQSVLAGIWRHGSLSAEGKQGRGGGKGKGVGRDSLPTFPVSPITYRRKFKSVFGMQNSSQAGQFCLCLSSL